MGASFARLTNAPISVWLKANEAAMIGELSVIEPTTGNRIKLFTNHSTPNQPVTISDFVNIPVGQIVTFEYKVVDLGWWATNAPTPEPSVWWPKYTGPNRKNSKYVSPASSNSNPNPAFRHGNIWSVIGRVSPDVLVFGFEDNTGATSDMDFDDIVYQTKGLAMVRIDKGARSRSYIW